MQQIIQAKVDFVTKMPEGGCKLVHGASPKSGFAYLAVTPTKKGKTIWLEPVSDKDYKSLKQKISGVTEAERQHCLPLGKIGDRPELQFYSYRLPHQDPGQHALSDVGPVQPSNGGSDVEVSVRKEAGLIRWIASVAFWPARREVVSKSASRRWARRSPLRCDRAATSP